MTWSLSFKSYRALFEAEQQRHADEKERADHWKVRALEESTRADRAEAEVKRLKAQPTLFCSLCGKSQHKAKKLIAGPPHVFICDDCTRLCMDVLVQEGQKA